MSNDGWLLKVHSEQDHLPSSDREVELRELELLLVEGLGWKDALGDTEIRRLSYQICLELALIVLDKCKKLICATSAISWANFPNLLCQRVQNKNTSVLN